MVRGEVARDKRPEDPPTREVLLRIDFLRLPQEGIPSRRVGGMGVAVVTTTLTVDDVAAQADERSILAPQIERDRRDLKTAFDLALVVIDTEPAPIQLPAKVGDSNVQVLTIDEGEVPSTRRRD